MLKKFCAAVLLALLGMPAGFAQASAQTMVLPDCAGKSQIRPTQVVMTCADAGIAASNLQWTGWGQTFAAAQGIMSINDCKPYCAAGHFHKYRVIVIASGHQTCSNGASAYQNVTYAFVGNRGPRIADPTARFKCN